MIRLLVIVSIALLMSSCQTVRTKTTRIYVVSAVEKPAVPMPKAFSRIHRETYELHKNDCSNKSAKYASLLHDHGYDAGVAILRPEGVKDFTHAVTTVRRANGVTLYCCPTTGTNSTIASTYGKLIVVIPYNLLPLSTLFGIPPEEFDFRK